MRNPIPTEERFVVIDIDGTLAENSNRQRFLESNPPDWKSFFSDSEILKDEPIYPVIDLCRSLITVFRATPVFLTGRPESTRRATLKWLSAHVGNDVVADSILLMRPEGNRQSSFVFKQDCVQNIALHQIICCIEDNTKCGLAFKELGLQVLQVANHDY